MHGGQAQVIGTDISGAKHTNGLGERKRRILGR